MVLEFTPLFALVLPAKTMLEGFSSVDFPVDEATSTGERASVPSVPAPPLPQQPPVPPGPPESTTPQPPPSNPLPPETKLPEMPLPSNPLPPETNPPEMPPDTPTREPKARSRWYPYLFKHPTEYQESIRDLKEPFAYNHNERLWRVREGSDVQSDWEELVPKLEDIVRRTPARSATFPSIAFDSFIGGKDLDHALPVVTISCSSKDYMKQVTREIGRTKVLKGAQFELRDMTHFTRVDSRSFPKVDLKMKETKGSWGRRLGKRTRGKPFKGGDEESLAAELTTSYA
jgi:hypothetical protein